MNEAEIKRMMDTLKISREEAIDLIKDDEAIDKGEKLFELTPEQKKNAKAATITTSAKPVRKNVKRERKPDEVKREIIETIAQNIDRCCFGEDLHTVENVSIPKPEKEITFTVNGEEYSITLTKHRPKKEGS